MLNAGHAALTECVATRLDSLPGWAFEPEVSFAFYGERGWIDILAWHAATRSLLVIEIKTEIGDVQEMLGTLDRKRRLARRIALERGWGSLTISRWLVVAEDSTNRRRVVAHRSLMRAALPADGHAIRSWLLSPSGSVAALSFWSDDAVASVRQRLATVRRVRSRNGAGSTLGARRSGGR